MRDRALETGSDEKLEIRCSPSTKKEYQRSLADLDPGLTYEEFLHVLLRVYEKSPGQFDRMHRYGR